MFRHSMVTERTQNLAIFATIYFLVSLGILGGVFFEMDRMTSNFQAQLTLLQANAEQEQEYNALIRKVEDTEEERSKLQQYILNERDSISFLTEIEQLSLSPGIELVTEALNKVDVEGSTYDDLDIGLTFSGTFNELQSLIKVLESLPYHGSVNTVRISKEGETFSGTIALTLSLIPYD